MTEDTWEHIGGDEDARVGLRIERDPPPSFTVRTNDYTHRQWERDLRLWQAMAALAKNRQGGWLLRQLKRESRSAAVEIYEVLLANDGIELVIVAELDRWYEITQNQDQASKIQRVLHLAQRDMKQDPNFLSCVARRQLHYQKIGNAL